MKQYIANCKLLVNSKWFLPGSIVELDDEKLAKSLLAEKHLLDITYPEDVEVEETWTVSKWIFDPRLLERYDLASLNALIEENDEEEGEPFDSKEDAIAFLSQDFEKWQALSSKQ